MSKLKDYPCHTLNSYLKVRHKTLRIQLHVWQQYFQKNYLEGGLIKETVLVVIK